MERKPFTLQWETSESVSTRPGHTNRCIQGGLGGFVSGTLNRGSLDKPGEGETYKCIRTAGCETRNIDFHKNVEGNIDRSPNRQHNCTQLSSKNGRDKESRVITNLKTNMGISHITTDHDYYRILAKQAECGSRLGVPKHSGHKRLETEPTGFSENNQNNGNPRHGSI